MIGNILIPHRHTYLNAVVFNIVIRDKTIMSVYSCLII